MALSKATGKQGARHKGIVEEDDGDFDFCDTVAGQFPAGPSIDLAHIRQSSTTSSSASSSMPKLQRDVVGQGLSGGTITRLRSGSRPSLPTTSLKSRAQQVDEAWEEEMDFGMDDDDAPLVFTQVKRGLILSLPGKSVSMPGPDVLDDLDLDMGEDDNEATLKAGATIKAMLPPPRIRPAPKTPPTQDIGLEDDLVLPLNMTNLHLATQVYSRPVKPRASNASTATEGWGSPSTSASGKKSNAWGGSWGEDSPKRMSESSATSVSASVPGSAKKDDCPVGENDEEDMEFGIEIPSLTFFSASAKRAKELNTILDRKRKPQYAPLGPPQSAAKRDSLRRIDESMEDGLILDDPASEISKRQLHKQKNARTANLPLMKRGSRNIPGSTKDREKAWEKEREQGWGWKGTITPGRERSQSGVLGLTGTRSQSATVERKDPSTVLYRRPETPLVSSRDPPRTRPSRLSDIMAPPPLPHLPTLPSLPPTPSSANRLRHQTSHYQLPTGPPQSPSLSRKQSLASLQDAMASSFMASSIPEHHIPPPNAPSPVSRYHSYSSQSRFTMPTSSSKAKIRTPISAIFPTQPKDMPSSSSAGSISSSASGTSNPYTPRYSGGSFRQAMSTPRMTDLPRRLKMWGDGKELEGIEDLEVDDSPKRGAPSIGLGKASRKGEF